MVIMTTMYTRDHMSHPRHPSRSAPCNYLHKVAHRSPLKVTYLTLCLRHADVMQDLKVVLELQLSALFSSLHVPEETRTKRA